MISILSALLFSLLAVNGEEEESYWYGLIIFLIRLTSNITFNMSYLQSATAFPTLTTGLAFTITNACCRACTMLAPLIAESVPNPSFTIFIINLFAGLMQNMYRKNTI